jgi:hypothetical protein
MTTPNPAHTLFDLITAHRITASIYVAARLGVADRLAEAPRTVAELATMVGAHENSLGRLLGALVTFGICTQDNAKRFQLTAIGMHLSGGADKSLKAWAIFEGKMLWPSWDGFLESIRTGKSRGELAGPGDHFEQMARNPAFVEVFNGAMANLTRLATPDILSACQFAGVSRLMDVGGGVGELLAAILTAQPSMRGIIFDLPRCAEGATRQIRDAGIGNRCEFISGDFFKDIPTGADAIILKSIIHDWEDKRSVEIFRGCRRALPPAGKLFLVERLMAEAPEATAEHRAVALSDLNMLRNPGGAERTAREYREILQQADFEVVRVSPAGIFGVIEAVAPP